MRTRIAHTPAVLVASTVLAVAAMPAGASAATGEGEITRAEANAAWTLGSVAGSATWSGCPMVWEPEPPWYEFPPGYEPGSGSEWPTREDCRVQAFVTVGPGSEASDCSAEDRKWPHSNEQISLAWSSGETLGWGSAEFDVSEVPLSGAPGQLACLSLLETYEERPNCGPEEICPLWIAVVQNYSVLDSAPLVAPLPEPPANTEAPQISGTPVVGETLTCSDGAWERAESFGYAWLRDGAPIEGEAGATYLVQSVDRGHSLACEVTATNEGGSTAATSESLAVPPPPPPSSQPGTEEEPPPEGTQPPDGGTTPPSTSSPPGLGHDHRKRAGRCSRRRHRGGRHRRHGRHRRRHRHRHGSRKHCVRTAAAMSRG
jgi:hypothetical protein